MNYLFLLYLREIHTIQLDWTSETFNKVNTLNTSSSIKIHKATFVLLSKINKQDLVSDSRTYLRKLWKWGTFEVKAWWKQGSHG